MNRNTAYILALFSLACVSPLCGENAPEAKRGGLYTPPPPPDSDMIDVDGKSLRRADALPILTKMLDGPPADAKEALKDLAYFYGVDALSGTEQMNKALALLKRTESSISDDMRVKLAQGGGNLTHDEQALIDLQLSAFGFVVLSKDPRGNALLERYLQSSQEPERTLGKLIAKEKKMSGYYTRGGKPALTPPPKKHEDLFSFPGERRAMTKSRFAEKATEVLDSRDYRSIKTLLRSIRDNPRPVKDSPLFDALANIFKNTDVIPGGPADEMKAVKMDIVIALTRSGDVRVKEFLKHLGDTNSPYFEAAQKEYRNSH